MYEFPQMPGNVAPTTLLAANEKARRANAGPSLNCGVLFLTCSLPAV